MSADGTLEVGTNGRGEVIIVHRDIELDKDGVGYIVFSVEEARNLGMTLFQKARDAEKER